MLRCLCVCWAVLLRRHSGLDTVVVIHVFCYVGCFKYDGLAFSAASQLRGRSRYYLVCSSNYRVICVPYMLHIIVRVLSSFFF